jgi:amino-acid N-acetyltransferase
VDISDYVKAFRNSAPYINAHRGRTMVLAFGGEAVADSNFANIIHDIALLNSLGVKLVLIHGARPQIEARASARGVAPRIHKGLRITDEETLECVKDAAGSLRAQIEALLTMGVANSPMHGSRIRVCSGNFVIAKPLGIHDGVDYEHTGLVRRIDIEAIHAQLAEKAIVLLSNLGYSPTGEVFNLSFEDVATQTALALKADKFILFTEQDGLMDANGELIEQCELQTVRNLIQQTPDVTMQRQIGALLQCAEKGVARCHVISFKTDGALLQELFTRDGNGTLISHQEYEQLRPATIDDVGGILELIQPLEADGTLVKRSRELLETEINQFTVIERDGMIIACASLHPISDSRWGEIACVATHPDYRGEDRGERLLMQLQQQAKKLKLEKVFVLTTRTAHWFQEHGFVEVEIADLPPARQALYNFQRNSKAFAKQL